MDHSDEKKSLGSQQEIKAIEGGTVHNAIQAMVSGVVGDVHIGNKIYYRSEIEELKEYLKQAVFAYERQKYQTLRHQPLPDIPYRSLYPFEVEDAHLFFGRDTAIQEFYEKVVHNRLMVLHARSGAGKTSLLKAGLSSHLIRAARLPVYIRIRPYRENPVEELKRAVTPPSNGPWPKLLADLSMHAYLGLVCHYLSRQTRELVIILDQFEEFIVSLPEPDVRLPFMKVLRDCFEDDNLPIRFVISLRRENLWDLDEFELFIPQIMDNRYGLPLMTQNEIREAITGPIHALQKNIAIETELLDSLIDDLGRTDVELTHLQLVCSRLYESLPEGEKSLSFGLYRSLGRAEKILASYLDETLAKLPYDRRSMARDILKELVSSEASNRILNFSDFYEVIRPDRKVIAEVLEYLVDKRLLRQSFDKEEKEYELAHAYLAEKVFHWVGQDELPNKRAQELLQRELASSRVHGTLVDEDKLNILRHHIKYLTLDEKAQDVLFRSALEQGHDVAFWLEKVNAEEPYFEQIVNELINANKQLCAKISDNLTKSLAQPLQKKILSPLWSAFYRARGRRKRHVANVLWKFRAWLPREESLRLFPVLFPIWAFQGVIFVGLPLIIVSLAISPVRSFLTREKAIPGKWVQIPAGDFVMGMDRLEAEFAHEQCLKGATNKNDCYSTDELLDRSGRQVGATLLTYQIMDNEVTNAQYQQCVDDHGCLTPDDWSYDITEINYPATDIDWLEATAYCKWLGGRLPTEAEWEKAARGPSNKFYPWGNFWEPSKANLEHQDTGSVQSIDQFAESDISDYRVKNLAGNVREWTASTARLLPENQNFLDLPLDIIDMGGEERTVTVRGGSWRNERSEGMTSKRGRDGSLIRRPTLGLRCVCPSGQTCASPWKVWWIWRGEY